MINLEEEFGAPSSCISLAQSANALSLVLPTLEEAATIEFMLRRTAAVLTELGIPFELIVVDDGSSDGTARIVSELSLEIRQLRLVQRKGERGLSGAILHGWNFAAGDTLGVIDADLQHPPEILPALWRAMQQGTDVAVASRYAHGATIGRWRWLRRALSSSAVVLCRPLQGEHCMVKDPMSGFFLTRRSLVRDLPQLQRSGFKLLLEILVRAQPARVREVPFCFGVRQGGRSKANGSVLRAYFALLLRLYWSRFMSAQKQDRAAAFASTAPPPSATKPE